MEDLYKFLRLVKRYRYGLVIIPAIAVIVTYILVRNLPNSYVSQARIATGIVDDTQQSDFLDGSTSRRLQVNQEFSNLVEMMRMTRILDQVSYQLIIHDLIERKPFRKYSNLIRELSPGSRKNALQVYRDKYNNTEGLNLRDPDQNDLYQVLKSMQYDSRSLLEKLRINRVGDSDFINIEFESENPELSAYVVNTLATEFIKYYTVIVKANQRKATTFLASVLSEKKRNLDHAVDSLRNYKILNRVLNLAEQSSQLYSQIIDYTNRKQEVIKSIASNTGALNEIDRKFEPRDRKYYESVYTGLNQRIISLREELRALSDLYIQNDFDQGYKNSIDSLNVLLTSEINRSNDLYITNPLATKQELAQQKLNLEIQLDLSRYSLNSIEKQLANLNAQYDQLVPHEAVVQALEKDVELARDEYMDILGKYNQSNMASEFAVKLNLVQTAMPGLAQPSKKMLLVILSGIISFIFCMVVLFLLFLLDSSIISAKELANKTQVPVLGGLQLMDGKSIDLKDIWKHARNNSPAYNFKEELRSIRFEIENELNGKILSVTSISSFEGKTLLALSLAYAFRMTSKRVLLIDGNFVNPEISRSSATHNTIYLENFFVDSELFNHNKNGTIGLLANRGGDVSVFELADDLTIRKKLTELKEHFDLIIIDTPSLGSHNQAREWISLSDNVLVVFESGKNMNDDTKSAISYLKSLDEKFIGWVMNKLGQKKPI